MLPATPHLTIGCIATLDGLPCSGCAPGAVPGIGGMPSLAGPPQTMQRCSFSQHTVQRVNSARFVWILVRHEVHSWILESTLGRLSLVPCRKQYFGGAGCSLWLRDTMGCCGPPGVAPLHCALPALALAAPSGPPPGLGLEFSTIDRTGVAASRGSGVAELPHIMQRPSWSEHPGQRVSSRWFVWSCILHFWQPLKVASSAFGRFSEQSWSGQKRAVGCAA